jgi:hypothetical protein
MKGECVHGRCPFKQRTTRSLFYHAIFTHSSGLHRERKVLKGVCLSELQIPGSSTSKARSVPRRIGRVLLGVSNAYAHQRTDHPSRIRNLGKEQQARGQGRRVLPPSRTGVAGSWGTAETSVGIRAVKDRKSDPRSHKTFERGIDASHLGLRATGAADTETFGCVGGEPDAIARKEN